MATKREDVHVIFATLLGLSPSEIMLCEREKRMLTMLKAQTYLPAAMLFLHHPDDTELVAGYEWVPVFPSRLLAADSGRMEWTADGCGLSFRPRSDDICTVIAGSDIERLRRFYLKGSGVAQAGGYRKPYLQLALLPAQLDCLRTLGGHEICLIIHRGANCSWGVGACLILSSYLRYGNPIIRFVCPLVYEWIDHLPNVPMNPVGRTTGNLLVDSKPIQSENMYVLLCGERALHLAHAACRKLETAANRFPRP
jgi:hypothetical protein